MAERAVRAPHGHAHGTDVDTTHRHERPEDWGWHASFGKWARIAGWLSVAFIVLNNVTPSYNAAHTPWLYGAAAVLVLLLVRDHFRRKNAWRQ